MPRTPPRALSGPADIREAIRLLRDTVIEDRKQMLYRVAFAVGLVAFTFKDLKLGASGALPLRAGLIGGALALLGVGSAFFYHHFYKSIAVLARLSESVAYADLSAEDLALPELYWNSGKWRWRIGSAAFFVGLAAYALALVLALVFGGAHA